MRFFSAHALDQRRRPNSMKGLSTIRYDTQDKAKVAMVTKARRRAAPATGERAAAPQ